MEPENGPDWKTTFTLTPSGFEVPCESSGVHRLALPTISQLDPPLTQPFVSNGVCG